MSLIVPAQRPTATGRAGGAARCAWPGALFRNGLAPAAELGGEVLELGQAVAHRQHGLGVVDVHAGPEGDSRDGRSENVDQAERRMVGHQVPAALRAELALAELGLREG